MHKVKLIVRETYQGNRKSGEVSAAAELPDIRRTAPIFITRSAMSITVWGTFLP